MRDYVKFVNLYPGLSTADAQTLIDRAVSPEIAAMRGYRTVTAEQARECGFSPSQARSGIEIPRHNTQGIVDDCAQLRPHEPRLDEKGRPRKYELPTGARQILDVTPRSLKHLANLDIPILVTESILKADAAESDAPPDTLCIVSVNGTYGWRTNGAPLTDFKDVTLCGKKSDKVIRRRRVVIAFDSDTATNPKVATARHELTDYLTRRGAKVEHIDVPEGPGGEKRGVDDSLANGYRLAELLALAHPPRCPDPDDVPDDPDRQRIAELEATIDDLKSHLRHAQARHHADLEILGDSRRPAQERITAVVLAHELERIAQHTTVPHAGEETVTVDQTGGILVHVGNVARLAGTSTKHTTDCLKKLEAEHVIRRSVTRAPTGETFVNAEGEIVPKYVSIARITPTGDLETLRGSMLMAATDRVPRKKPTPRNRCIAHPDADVITRIADECSVCHHQIGTVRDRRRTAGAEPTDTPTTTQTAPMILNTPLVVSQNTPEVLSESTPLLVTTLTAPTLTTTAPGVLSGIAPTPANAVSYPRFAPTPVDRWTDLSLGGRP
jgi:hypothetical protein